MIPAAIIAGIVLLAVTGAVFYWLGHKGASSDIVAKDAKDEAAQNAAAQAAKEKIEASTKAELEKIPAASTTDLAQMLLQAPSVDGGILVVEKKSK